MMHGKMMMPGHKGGDGGKQPPKLGGKRSPKRPAGMKECPQHCKGEY